MSARGAGSHTVQILAVIKAWNGIFESNAVDHPNTERAHSISYCHRASTKEVWQREAIVVHHSHGASSGLTKSTTRTIIGNVASEIEVEYCLHLRSVTPSSAILLRGREDPQWSSVRLQFGLFAKDGRRTAGQAFAKKGNGWDYGMLVVRGSKA